MFLGSYFLLLPAILSCAHFISWLCKIEGTEHKKKTHKGPTKDCYCYCNLFSHGALRSSKNSLKRVRAFQIKMEFESIGF